MPNNFNKVFLGHTPRDQRNFLTVVLKHLRKDYNAVVIPACGHFTLAKCAIEAGYDKEKIFCSDISLYTSLLGYLFSGKPVDSIDFHLSTSYQQQYDKYETDIEKVAFVIWLMKVKQMEKFPYASVVMEDLNFNKDAHIAKLVDELKKQVEYYSGINYEIKDLREELRVWKKLNPIIIVNPPVFAKGYTKMFDFGEDIVYNPKVEEFIWSKEYIPTYEKSKELPHPVIWYRFGDASEFNPDEIIFSKEYKINKHDFWLITKPEVLKDFDFSGYVSTFRRKKYKPYKAPIWGLYDKMTPDSKVRFVKVNNDVGLYYRDLFAHRLGNTNCEICFLMLIDGKVYSTVGFTVNHAVRLQDDYAFENYGFSAPSKIYPHENRLLMMMISSKDMKNVLINAMAKRNRFFTLKGFKTTCLSKYRSMKTHRGILERTSRELLPNGMYKIKAQTDWHDRTFQETLRLYLKEMESYAQQPEESD